MDNYFSQYPAPISNTRPNGALTVLTSYTLVSSLVLLSQVEQVRAENDPQKHRALKRQLLPFATFGGTFTKRHIDGLQEVSGYLMLDFDHVPDVHQAKRSIVQNMSPLLVFTSPSGDGVKALLDVHTIMAGMGVYPLNCTDNKELQSKAAKAYADIYTRCVQRLSEVQGLKWLAPYIDLSAKDITRATYLSADCEAYLNLEKICAQ